jgi:hypothetical protein
MSGELENTMRSRLFSLIFPVLLAVATPAFARETLDSILPQIRAAHPGRLSDAEPFIGDDGRTHYRIKWMTPEGRILYFDADTQTGRYSNSGGDDSGRWRGGGEDRRVRGGDNQGEEGDNRHRHDNWNGPDNYGDRGGDWRDREGGDWRDRGNGGGDWHGRGNRGGEGNGPHQDGDWGDRHGGGWGGRPPGDWGGRGGDWGGHGGGWRGGRGGGNNGGGHGHGGH